MIEKDQQPTIGDMTGIARLFCGNVGIVFSRGYGAIMATFTGTCDSRVVHMGNPSPAECKVAELAGIG
jgi:hypothetical protein